MDPQQQLNLSRVSNAIAQLVLDFCRLRWKHDEPSFSMHELTEYVKSRASSPIAPDSPGRILRWLAKGSQVKYRLISRSRSLYQLIAVSNG